MEDTVYVTLTYKLSEGYQSDSSSVIFSPTGKSPRLQLRGERATSDPTALQTQEFIGLGI